MKKKVTCLMSALLVLAVGWVAFGQGGGQGGSGRTREAQLKAIAAIQEQVAKLKALMDQSPQGMQGRSFQDLSEEERTKMRESMTQRREEQQKIVASIEQELMRVKGGRQMLRDHEQSMTPLKELLASAQKENAKETAGKIEALIAQRQKQFEEKVTAMGYTMEQLQQMQQRRGQQQ